MDGVLWRGSESIGDLQSIFTQLNKVGWKVVYATNNASRTIKQYIDILSNFGVQADAQQIISSATAATAYLYQKFPNGGPVFIVGEEGLIDSCAERGFYQSESNALAVVAGIDRKLTYDKLKTATLLIRSGVPFIGTNPDRTFPTPRGLVPGAGAILAAISAASDVSPLIMGKPETTMYQLALDRLNLSAADVLVVGDRPETDIAGAQQIGCRTALVLSGVTNIEQARSWHPAPDVIVNDLATLVTSEW